jgi:hypothetical protein
MLGPAFDTLPPQVKALHDATEARRWCGQADVRRGRGLAARTVCRLVGFPAAGTGVPLTVILAPDGSGERWTRTFAGKTFASLQRPGSGRNAYLLLERFGPIEVALALVVENGRLYLVPRRWSLAGIPLPRPLLPNGASFECERDGRFGFDVEIIAPLIGLIVGYRGTLEPG